MNNRTKRKTNLKLKKNTTSIKAGNRSRKVKNDFSEKRKRQRGGRPWEEGEIDKEWSNILDKLNVHPIHWARKKNCRQLTDSLTDGYSQEVDVENSLQPRLDLTRMRCRMENSEDYIDYMEIIGDNANRVFSEQWYPPTEEQLTSAGVTPRTHWQYTHIDPRFIHALSASEDREYNMFQVTYTSLDQFYEFYNLAAGELCRYLELTDCVYQCFFALGLMRLDIAKKHAEMARTTSTTPYESITNFCKCAFGLDGDDIVYEPFVTRGDPHEFEQGISTFLNEHLSNGHATMLGYSARNERKPKGKRDRGHIIIVYKDRGTITYFDPQLACRRDAVGRDSISLDFHAQQIWPGEVIMDAVFFKMRETNDAGFFTLRTNECEVFDTADEPPPNQQGDQLWLPHQTD